PHKRNPITAERITGLARVIRANSLPAMEDVALWHERDISHSSVERVILPDSYTLMDYLLATTTKLVDNLVIRPDRMQQVLDSSYGLVFSQRVLLGLVEEGLTREQAYAAVQRNAMTAWDTGQPLRDLLAADPDVQGKIDPDRLDAMFDPSHHLRHLDEVFERVEAL
ncbi:MAG: adenylosuccinate lyase, partial [Miltoncostaeaceae bacterium]